MITGRVILSLYFFIPGILKYSSWDAHIQLMATHHIPVAGINLFFNRYTVTTCIILGVLVLLINFNLHDFWNDYDGINSAHEAQNFVKNLGILAGLSLLASMSRNSAGTEEFLEK